MKRRLPNPTDKHVGSRVRTRRLMLAMSQTEVGDALGLSFQQLQKYEKGTNRIGASRLRHLSSILQVSISFLFEGLSDVPAGMGAVSSPDYVTNFLATTDGLSEREAMWVRSGGEI